MLPAQPCRKILSTVTGLTTVAPSPYGKRSVSPASLRIISLAGSGSRGVSARASWLTYSARRCFYKPQLLFRCPPRATRNKGHTYRQSKVYSRNCSNISIGRGKRQPGVRGNVTSQLLPREKPPSSPRIYADERGSEGKLGRTGRIWARERADVHGGIEMVESLH